MKNITLLLSILLPIGCLFLPAYGYNLTLLESYYNVELLPVYGWLPAFVLIILSIIELFEVSQERKILSRKLTIIILLAFAGYQLLDIAIWKFHFHMQPRIAPISIVALYFLKFLELKRVPELKK
ncbi:MAG: hypothetical protein QNK23_11430 [Crocinitomicaceae bacterium]|nr:hypothetical protein [Crocinitomicaceae bacterium]